MTRTDGLQTFLVAYTSKNLKTLKNRVDTRGLRGFIGV